MPARLLLGFGLAAVLAARSGTTPEVLRLEGDLSPIHDPAIIREGRTFHLFASNRFADKLVPMFCSTDRRRWALCGNVFDAVPEWALQEVPGARGIWAPYIDKDGRPMMEGGGSPVVEGTEAWRGPGHEAVLLEKDADLLVFHAYDGVTGRPTLQISTLVWEDGWPRAGRLP